MGEKPAAKAQSVPGPVIGGPPANRRPGVGLLPRRPRPGQAAEVTSELPVEEEKPVEENLQEEPEASEAVSTVASTTEQPATPENKLSSLIGGRRRIGGRRPGTLIGRPASEE